jgi:hypothetical protein
MTDDELKNIVVLVKIIKKNDVKLDKSLVHFLKEINSKLYVFH